jgi:hypothetical protein
MPTMTTTQHRGLMPGRARRVAPGAVGRSTCTATPRSWRGGSADPTFLGGGGTCATATNPFVFEHTANTGTTGLSTIKCTARYLGTRST